MGAIRAVQRGSSIFLLFEGRTISFSFSESWCSKVLSEHKIPHQVIQNKTENWSFIVSCGAIALLVKCWTWKKKFLFFRVTGLIPERCCTFFLFGQELQLEVWNYIHSKLLPISFQKNHSSSYFIKIMQQEMTFHLRSSLLSAYCSMCSFS